MSMLKPINWLLRSSLVAIVFFLSLIMRLEEVQAQANRSNGGDIVCPGTGGGVSIQVIAARSSRYSYVINNTSGLDIRLGLIASGIPALTTSNSILLKASQPYSDSAPGGYSGRIVCQSTTAATATISFMETYR